MTREEWEKRHYERYRQLLSGQIILRDALLESEHDWRELREAQALNSKVIVAGEEFAIAWEDF